jgi:hypothetical protein
MKRLASFVTIIAAAFALTAGTASAATGTNTFHAITGVGCSFATESVGTASWDTETATVKIRVRNLSPSTEYQVQTVAGCAPGNIENLGTLTTNKKGKASGSFTFTPQGVRRFLLVPTTGTVYSTDFIALGA